MHEAAIEDAEKIIIRNNRIETVIVLTCALVHISPLQMNHKLDYGNGCKEQDCNWTQYCSKKNHYEQNEQGSCGHVERPRLCYLKKSRSDFLVIS